MAILDVAITHRFSRFALDVKFSSDGPVLGIFGPSGSGKSTILHAIAGLFAPKVADISVRTRTVQSHLGTFVAPERREIGYVTQDALLFPHLSVRQNLLYAPRADGLDSLNAKRILDVLRLEPLLKRAPANLSGGEKQRVALGRALLSQPQLLLLDEPMSALDAALSREVLALLLEVKEVLRVPMVLVSHRAHEIAALCDECIVLNEGKIAAKGAPLEVLARPGHSAGFDNILRLEITRHERDKGISWLELGSGQELAAPLSERALGSRASVGIFADEIILCLENPRGLSARNVLAAMVRSTVESGPDTIVNLKIGQAHTLLAHVTHSAAAELNLTQGREVFAIIKTSGCVIL